MSRDRRKRPGLSTAAVNASAVSCPTPGMLISRRHASDALTIRLMSPSIATSGEHGGTRRNQTLHGSGQAGNTLACLESLPDEGGAERTRQSDAEHHGQAADLVLESDPLPD